MKRMKKIALVILGLMLVATSGGAGVASAFSLPGLPDFGNPTLPGDPGEIFENGPKPYVETRNPSGLTFNGVTLNSYINPKVHPGIMYYEWGPVATGPYFKTSERAVPLPAGEFPIGLTKAGNNLVPNTTYYYRAVFKNPLFTERGEFKTFVIPNAPPPAPKPLLVKTNPATNVNQLGATLNGNINPQGEPNTVAYFEWGVTQSLGNTTAQISVAPAGADITVRLTKANQNLQPNTTYYYRAVGRNATGTVRGAILTFKLPPANPNDLSVRTDPATQITKTSATLNGMVNSAFVESTTARFQWGTSPTALTNTTQVVPVALAGSDIVTSIANLTPNTTYYFRIVGANPSVTRNGEVRSFTTLADATPNTIVVRTDPATQITKNSATLNGMVNPQGMANTVSYFEWGTSADALTNKTQEIPTPGSADISTSIAGLSPNTTYYFRIVGKNPTVTVNGAVRSFTTLADGGQTGMVVRTDAATAITSTSANLNGMVNPHGVTGTTAFFEWGTAQNSLTNTTPAVPVSSAGSDITASISGLSPNTTYYFRIVGTNAQQTLRGDIRSFTTLGGTQGLTANCSVTPGSAAIGATATWSVQASGGTGQFTYSWTGTDGLTGNTSSVQRSYSSTGTKEATVTVTSGAETISRTCSMTITSGEVSPLNASCFASPSSVRIGDLVTWTAQPTGGTGLYSYAWSGDDGLTGNATTSPKTYFQNGTYNASVRITSGSQVIDRTCSIGVFPPGGGGGGGGGLNQPSATVINRNVTPGELAGAFVYLSQVPYTGVSAATYVWILIIVLIWAAMIAGFLMWRKKYGLPHIPAFQDFHHDDAPGSITVDDHQDKVLAELEAMARNHKVLASQDALKGILEASHGNTFEALSILERSIETKKSVSGEGNDWVSLNTQDISK